MRDIRDMGANDFSEDEEVGNDGNTEGIWDYRQYRWYLPLSHVNHTEHDSPRG